MGGGVGIGNLGVTHGLGPEPGSGPTPPTPPGPGSSNADEREAEWERKRQQLRDWDTLQRYLRNQRLVQEQYAHMRAEMERGAAAFREEQRRWQAADVLRRYSTEELPDGRQRWSTAGEPTEEQATDVDASSESADATTSSKTARVEPLIAEPLSPHADYAILPVGDRADIQAMADGTVEYVWDPKRGLSAVLEAKNGQRFAYTRIGSLPRRQVKAGETIGFTPPTSTPRAEEARASNGSGLATHAPSLADQRQATAQLAPYAPSAMGNGSDDIDDGSDHPSGGMPFGWWWWLSSRSKRQRERIAVGIGQQPQQPPPPPMAPPAYVPEPPRPRSRKGLGVLVLLGIGGLALAANGQQKGRSRR